MIFNVYPMILNSYISFTDKNKFKPNPDCEFILNDILVPLCWDVFKENAPTGLGKPFTVAEPWYKNYQTLVGDLFSIDAVMALLTIGVCLVPLFGASVIDKRLERQESRSVPSIVIWLAAIGILNSIIGLYYYLIVLKHVYLYRSEDEDIPIPVTTPTRIALIVLTAGIVLIGAAFAPWFEWSTTAASILF